MEALPTIASQRKGIFNYIESYLNGFGGVDGASCLERALCEVAAAPDHEDGILGDAINYLLRVEKDGFVEHPKYAHAQEIGELTGDCFEFQYMCPVSIFNVIDTLKTV